MRISDVPEEYRLFVKNEILDHINDMESENCKWEGAPFVPYKMDDPMVKFYIEDIDQWTLTRDRISGAYRFRMDLPDEVDNNYEILIAYGVDDNNGKF